MYWSHFELLPLAVVTACTPAVTDTKPVPGVCGRSGEHMDTSSHRHKTSTWCVWKIRWTHGHQQSQTQSQHLVCGRSGEHTVEFRKNSCCFKSNAGANTVQPMNVQNLISDKAYSYIYICMQISTGFCTHVFVLQFPHMDLTTLV